jgi:iron complex transport system substrate-binding protein
VLRDGETPESVKARPGWSGISAVRNDRICEVDGDLTSRPGPRIMEGLEALYECLYEEK